MALQFFDTAEAQSQVNKFLGGTVGIYCRCTLPNMSVIMCAYFPAGDIDTDEQLAARLNRIRSGDQNSTVSRLSTSHCAWWQRTF